MELICAKLGGVFGLSKEINSSDEALDTLQFDINLT